MKYNYQIADMTITLDSDYLLIDNWESEQFRIGCTEMLPDWQCNIRGVNQLPKPEGQFISTTETSRLYLDGKTIWQELLNRKDNEPLFLAKYSRDEFSDMELWTLNSQQPYTARIEHIWAAVDFPYQLLQHEILTVHSAVIYVKDEAILFLAPSGTGKSTQARLWSETRGAKQLNGDKSGIIIKENKVLACGLPFSGTSGICTNYCLPIRAIVIVSQAKENTVIPLKGIQAVVAVMKNCFGHSNVLGCSEKILKILDKVLCQVKVYSLACTPDEKAVQALEKQLWEEV